MDGPSVGTAKASPVNKAQCDRRGDIEIDPPAHNISGPNGWVMQRCALGAAWLAYELQHTEQSPFSLRPSLFAANGCAGVMTLFSLGKAVLQLDASVTPFFAAKSTL